MRNNPFVDLGPFVRVGSLLVQNSLIIPGGEAVGHESFIYQATGAEGASFVVVFPTPRSSTSYVIHVGGAGLADFLLFDAPVDQYQTDRFRLDCSAAPTAGDRIAITVEAL